MSPNEDLRPPRLVIAHIYVNTITLLMVVMLFVLIASCKNSLEPSTGSLAGKVLLINDTGDSSLDPIDNSDITIAVYPLAVIDSTIIRLNNQYPGLGVIATQNTEFDHRSNSAIMTSLTHSDGSFYLDGLSEGQYNIVAMKSGWGFRYFYSVVIKNGTNVLPGDIETGAVALYPEQKISGYLSAVNLSVGSFHHLVIENDTHILDGSSLILHPGAIVRVNPGVKLEVMGLVSIQGKSDSLVTFISNDAVFSTRRITPVAFEGIKFHASSTLAYGGLEYIKVVDSVSGLSFLRDFYIRNSVLQGVNEIVSVAGSYSDLLQVSIANCIFRVSSTSPNYDINIASASPVSFQKNIVLGNNGLACRASANVECKDNYINVSTIGLYFYEVSSVVVMYNDIVAGSNAIFTNYQVTSNLSYNNITAMDGLRYSSFGNISTASYNNLYCSHYSITYLDTSPEHQHLPAQNNWFNTIDNELIQSLILDKTDYSENDPLFPLLSYVDYTPYRTSKQSSAGIRS